MSSSPLDILKAADPALLEQIGNERELAFNEGELSKKHKLLIALAVDAVIRAEGGMKALAAQAMEQGATKGEIVEVLRIVHHICGVGCSYQAAMALKDVLQ